MRYEWKIVEEHLYDHLGKACSNKRTVAICLDYESAKRELVTAFDERWNEHSFPPDMWLSECLPPEESSDKAYFVSKFVDEGEFRFHIE